MKGLVVLLALSRGSVRAEWLVAPGSNVTGPRIAAAGDIACDPDSAAFADGNGKGLECRQKATSNLLVGGRYKAVLVLGDIQYEDGSYEEFLENHTTPPGVA